MSNSHNNRILTLSLFIKSFKNLYKHSLTGIMIACVLHLYHIYGQNTPQSYLRKNPFHLFYEEGAVMDLIQLKYFKVLAETENLTHAAEKLYLSAPALSASIHKLEREIEFPLFSRPSGKALQLNQNGRILLSAVNQIFDILAHTRLQLNEMDEGKNRTLSIGVATPMLFQDLFLAFRAVHPDIRISHSFLNLALLEDGEFCKSFDFLIAAPKDVGVRDMQSVPLYTKDVPMLMVYSEHPLAGREAVPLQELRDIPFIALSHGLSSRNMFDQIFEEAGFPPHIVYECDHHMRSHLIRQKQGAGITTLYTSTVNEEPGLAFVPISGVGYLRSQHLFWHHNRPLSRLAKQFRTFSLEYYQNLECMKQ